MIPDHLRPILGTEQIARLTQCSSTTVRRWIDRGLLAGWRHPGPQRFRRVLRVDLVAFLTRYGVPLGQLATPVKET